MVYFAIVWLLIGYASWRCVYYGTIKFWYIKYSEDLRKFNRGKNCLRILKYAFPIIVSGGPFNLLYFIFDKDMHKDIFDHGITLYFKIPKNDTENKESIQARDN